MRARALVALAIAWALVAVAPASAQEGQEGAAAGLGAGAADPEPVHRPGRGGLPRSGRSTTTCSSTSAPRTSARRPGIAKSWEISPDKKTITFKLFEGHKWSDGQPITSKDVKYSLETFAPNSLLFPSYVENITSIETPDDLTVVVKTKQPDARIVGGLFVYILPEHVWGKQSVKKLTGSYKPPVADRRQRPLRGHRVRAAAASSG